MAKVQIKSEKPVSYTHLTVASRIIDKVIEIELPVTGDGIHTLTLTPHDPAIVFEKIVIDERGGKKSVKVI